MYVSFDQDGTELSHNYTGKARICTKYVICSYMESLSVARTHSGMHFTRDGGRVEDKVRMMIIFPMPKLCQD